MNILRASHRQGNPRRPARRWTPVFAVAIAATVLVAGCGAQGADSADDASDGVPSATGEGVTSYPLTIDSDAGEVVIEAPPTRVAVVDVRPTSTDMLLELGVVPVLAPENFDFGGWTPQSDIDAIETIWAYGDSGVIDREMLLESAPDLIVHYSNRPMESDRAASLNQIAPTISFMEQDVSWREMQSLIAEVLDKSGRGEQILDEVDAVIADARESLAAHHGKTATIGHVHADGRIIYGSRSGRDAATLLEQLGFSLSDAGEQVPDSFEISSENIELLNADFLYLSATSEADAAPVIDTPLFRQLPVVEQGNVAYEFADTADGGVIVAWGLLVPGPRSLKAIVPRLAASANEVLA